MWPVQLHLGEHSRESLLTQFIALHATTTSAASTKEEAGALRRETTVFLSKISTHGCCTLPITCQPLGKKSEPPGDADSMGTGCSWLCVPLTRPAQMFVVMQLLVRDDKRWEPEKH